jgi:hypothetical protein
MPLWKDALLGGLLAVWREQLGETPSIDFVEFRMVDIPLTLQELAFR